MIAFVCFTELHCNMVHRAVQLHRPVGEPQLNFYDRGYIAFMFGMSFAVLLQFEFI